MSYIGNSPTSVAFLTDSFSGNGSTTAFTLTQAPANTSSILVAISGVLQDPSTYSVSGTTLTFSPAPPTGTANISVRFLGVPASGVTTTAYRTVTEFTATAGQTSFSVPSYTVGYIDVYRNGVMLGSADYTATSGLTVVLANGCTAGDLVEVISFQVSSVLNAIPATAGSVSASNLAVGAAASNIGTEGVTQSMLASGSVTQAKLSTGVVGNGPAFFAYAGSNTTLSQNAFTIVTLNTELYDTANCFNTSTYAFTPNVAGYYQINANVSYAPGTGSTAVNFVLSIAKNGIEYQRGSGPGIASTGNNYYCSVSALVYCNGTTDYISAICYSSGSNNQIQTGQAACAMSGTLVRAA